MDPDRKSEGNVLFVSCWNTGKFDLWITLVDYCTDNMMNVISGHVMGNKVTGVKLRDFLLKLQSE